MAGATLLAAGCVAHVPWSPAWTHTATTCALLGGGALLVGRGRTPLWFPARSRRAAILPLAVGLPLAGAATVLLMGPLDAPWDPSRQLALQAALVASLVPLAEEAFFRGALLRIIPGSRALAIAVSSLLFGALHLQLGPVQAGIAACGGGLLCVLALTTGSLVVPMVIHLVYNGLATSYQEKQPALLLASVLAILGLSVLGGFLARRRP